MVKKVIGVFVLGLIAGGGLGLQQVMSLTPVMERQVIIQFGFKQVLIFVSMLQTALLASIATIAGSYTACKVGLNKPFKFSKRSTAAALAIGCMSACFIAVLEKLVFIEVLGLENKFEFSWIYFLGSLLYGGIIEEILLRFGIMSLIVWIISKRTRSISNGAYITGIVIAALLFALGHLPATVQMLGLSPISVIRTLLLNFLPGIGFGYLYWKHGLTYGILGHMSTHIISQCILFPLLFR